MNSSNKERPRVKVLFVSALFPKNILESAAGGFQRMRMWLEAVRSLGGELEMLFLHRSDAKALSESAYRVLDAWECRCLITQCECEAPARQDTLIGNYLLPALGLKRNPDFGPYIGASQSEAFAKCLARA